MFNIGWKKRLAISYYNTNINVKITNIIYRQYLAYSFGIYKVMAVIEYFLEKKDTEI